VTKSTTRKVRCVSCGEDYFAKRAHSCDPRKVKSGRSTSTPQQVKSRKMMFGKGGR
jgi:hypothetical protein